MDENSKSHAATDEIGPSEHPPLATVLTETLLMKEACTQNAQAESKNPIANLSPLCIAAPAFDRLSKGNDATAVLKRPGKHDGDHLA
jgi:hypothetical protein